MIKIERALNGWIVRHKEEDEPLDLHVFDTGDDSERDTAEAFADMLWKIKELIGPLESRYSAHRVMITIQPGDKHASHPDNQEEAE
jgi:hypothetical protein